MERPKRRHNHLGARGMKSCLQNPRRPHLHLLMQHGSRRPTRRRALPCQVEADDVAQKGTTASRQARITKDERRAGQLIELVARIMRAQSVPDVALDPATTPCVAT